MFQYHTNTTEEDCFSILKYMCEKYYFENTTASELGHPVMKPKRSVLFQLNESLKHYLLSRRAGFMGCVLDEIGDAGGLVVGM